MVVVTGLSGSSVVVVVVTGLSGSSVVVVVVTGLSGSSVVVVVVTGLSGSSVVVVVVVVALSSRTTSTARSTSKPTTPFVLTVAETVFLVLTSFTVLSRFSLATSAFAYSSTAAASSSGMVNSTVYVPPAAATVKSLPSLARVARSLAVTEIFTFTSASARLLFRESTAVLKVVPYFAARPSTVFGSLAAEAMLFFTA